MAVQRRLDLDRGDVLAAGDPGGSGPCSNEAAEATTARVVTATGPPITVPAVTGSSPVEFIYETPSRKL
jgi:hypothetical protein